MPFPASWAGKIKPTYDIGDLDGVQAARSGHRIQMIIRAANATQVNNDRDQPAGIDSASGESLCSVELASEVSPSIDLRWLRLRLSEALGLISESTGRRVEHVDVFIAYDRHMVELNRAHAGVDHTTDVLSFDLAEGGKNAPIQAEIAVCADEAARRAAEFGHSIERELLLYCVHGILHCSGYDDQTDEGYAMMHAEEDRILKAIGVGETFAAPPNAAAIEGESK